MEMYLVPVTHDVGQTAMSLQQAALALQARLACEKNIGANSLRLVVSKSPAQCKVYKYKSKASTTYYNLPELKPIYR